MNNNLAIRYAMKKRAMKMARGGRVHNPKLQQAHMASQDESMPMAADEGMASGGPVMCAHGGPLMCAYGCYAKGGLASEKAMDESEDKDNRPSWMLPHLYDGGMIDDEKDMDLPEGPEDNDLDPMSGMDEAALMEDEKEDDEDRKLGILGKILSRKNPNAKSMRVSSI